MNKSFAQNVAFTAMLASSALGLLQCHPLQAAPVTLLWTATGDDGTIGMASAYDARYAADSTTLIAWTAASQMVSEPIPKTSGQAETWNTTLPAGVWYIAIKVRDEAFNWSDLSNIVRVEIDETKPAAIVDFRRP